jgi:outer membrane receptor for ferric coprogen and ferric-rhodotorulic acid
VLTLCRRLSSQPPCSNVTRPPGISAEAPQGKDSVRATTTTIGKGNQELRDIPQSVTVVTEKLIDDRNLDT